MCAQIYLIFYFLNIMMWSDIKANAVPLHAMKALGGRGCVAPTHSRPRH
jgi:hypothetical protein